MSNDVIHKDKREVGGFTFKIKWHFDDDGDTSWMGEYVRNEPSDAWYVDRERDVLLGEWLSGNCTHCGDDCDTLWNGHWLCSDCNDDMPESPTVDLEEAGRREYDTLTSSHYTRNSYRWWVPGENHNPPNKQDIRPYEKWQQDWLDRGGLSNYTEAEIRCILEDHKIMEDLVAGNIWFEWYECTMYAGDIELDSTSLGGILDPGDKDRDTYFQEAIDELLAGNQDEIKVQIEQREKEIAKLKEYLTV